MVMFKSGTGSMVLLPTLDCLGARASGARASGSARAGGARAGGARVGGARAGPLLPNNLATSV